MIPADQLPSRRCRQRRRRKSKEWSMPRNGSRKGCRKGNDVIARRVTLAPARKCRCLSDEAISSNHRYGRRQGRRFELEMTEPELIQAEEKSEPKERVAHSFQNLRELVDYVAGKALPPLTPEESILTEPMPFP